EGGRSPVGGSLILGALFWTGVQFIVPVIASYFLDVFLVPIAVAVVVGIFFQVVFPKFRIVAWSFVAGTVVYSFLFSAVIGV
ncbi:hypothetical protein, partial [Streptomyces sp. NPDC014791]|uniref:hypothetical protein n=1 Tax=Streptomyces sp. NPDC014791 TaxID=3364912 RepID=UPI0037000A3D